MLDVSSCHFPFCKENNIEFKYNYSEEQKTSDRECLEILIEKGGKMSDNEITFKKVMERGEKIRI